MEGDVYVDYAFSYSSPNIESVLAKDEYKNCREITVIPLYPQHSSSTTASVYDQISKFHEKRYFVPKLNFVNSFAGNKRYIQALAGSVQAHWSQYGHAQKLIVSFHSIPLNLIEGGDIYLQECQLTYHLLCSKLNLDPERDAVLTFQSRFGRAKWLEPATAATIVLLARAEVKSLDVICPGFISDCLETLEEIAIQNRQLFIDNGGAQLNYISCLNDSDACIDVLYDLAFEKRD